MDTRRDTTRTPPLDLVNAVLDFIRANLQNIERTWGIDSPQYRSTREIMQQYWNENAEKLKGEDIGINLDARLEDLLAGLSLKEESSLQSGMDVKMS